MSIARRIGEIAGATLDADSEWIGTQQFTSTFGGDQSTAAGTYPTSGGGNPGIEFANGTTNWRIDNSSGTLRFLEAGIATVASLDLDGLFITSGVITSSLGVGSEFSARNPSPVAVTIDGSTLDGTHLGDKVGHALTAVFEGGFSAEGGRGLVNPGWLWGANDFVVSGTTSGDLAGIQDLQGRLTEVHCQSPSATLNTLTGQQVEAKVSSTATSATVVDMYSLRVVGPRVDNGVVTNAYGLLVTQPTTTGSGSITTTNKALFVGGDTQLDGALTLSSITTTTSASAGGASALPATPAGYVTINVGGTNRKIAYYA